MGINRCSHIEVREAMKVCLQYSSCQTPSREDFEFMINFVIEQFGYFKLNELMSAFKLYASDKLEVDKHILFTPKMIGEVLNAYKKLAVQVRQKTQPKEQVSLNASKVDEEQAIEDERQYWANSKNKDWRMLNYMVFDYLWKRKLLNISKEKAEAIKSKVKAHYQTRIKTDADREAVQDDVFIKLACKRYSLALYFNGELN